MKANGPETRPGVLREPRWFALSAIAFAAILCGLHVYADFSNFLFAWAAFTLLTRLFTGSFSFGWEAAILAVFIFLPGKTSGLTDPFLNVPLVAAAFSAAAHLSGHPRSHLLVASSTAVWYLCAFGASAPPGWTQAALCGLTASGMAIPLLAQSNRTGGSLASVDLILCSNSGNTGHYAGCFAGGAEASGVRVAIHRFHDRMLFAPTLAGGALVVAFPVSGWKPPWPLLDWLLFRLPRGGGRPAFVLCTAAGGPENAGQWVWLILALKGYRVLGRQWAIYPFNVPTVRLGPRLLWKLIDRLVPDRCDLAAARECGASFASGRRCGLPLFFWPFPLIFAGLLLDNRVVNRLYRPYAWKWKCTKCGLCIRACPSRRLKKGPRGFPVASGECALCLCCVNGCPEGAMHMALFTELGQRYETRFPEHLPPRRFK